MHLNSTTSHHSVVGLPQMAVRWPFLWFCSTHSSGYASVLCFASPIDRVYRTRRSLAARPTPSYEFHVPLPASSAHHRPFLSKPGDSYNISRDKTRKIIAVGVSWLVPRQEQRIPQVSLWLYRTILPYCYYAQVLDSSSLLWSFPLFYQYDWDNLGNDPKGSICQSAVHTYVFACHIS